MFQWRRWTWIEEEDQRGRWDPNEATPFEDTPRNFIIDDTEWIKIELLFCVVGLWVKLPAFVVGAAFVDAFMLKLDACQYNINLDTKKLLNLLKNVSDEPCFTIKS